MNPGVSEKEIDDMEIGRFYQIWTTDKGHPKMKFEKHLRKIYPEKYQDYPLYFIGKYKHRYCDKWTYGNLLEFTEIEFPMKKKRKSHLYRYWQIWIKDIKSINLLPLHQEESN